MKDLLHGTEPIAIGLRRINLSLSPLLRYVLVMVCQGLTDKEIAVRLDVGVRTASGYVGRLFTATKTNNRAALVTEVLCGVRNLRREAATAAKAWEQDLVVVKRARP